MKVLVIGSGGREHALAWKLSQSKKVKKIYCAPGNAGTQELAINIALGAEDLKNLVKFAKREKIDLTIVGPDNSLALGIVDKFEKAGLKIFGPNKKAAQIEASKIFAKRFMKKFNIPTADFKVFSDHKKVLTYLHSCSFPQVIKADGLALGKGVSICHSFKEAKKEVEKIMVKKTFGEAGKKIVIEEYLLGQEASILAFADGQIVVPMIPSQDHKQVFDGDKGPNTGGMGCYAPVPIITSKLMRQIIKEVLIPAVKGMRKIGRPYKGILYAGLMVKDNQVKVLEFNARFGDPETQVVLPLLRTDLLEIIESCLSGNLDKIRIKWRKEACVCVVLASGGYPLEYKKGKEIKGLGSFKGVSDSFVFHAGTALNDKHRFVTNGGRVLCVSSVAPSLKQAKNKSYQGVKRISFDGMHYRTDIGMKALRLEK